MFWNKTPYTIGRFVQSTRSRMRSGKKKLRRTFNNKLGWILARAPDM